MVKANILVENLEAIRKARNLTIAWETNPDLVNHLAGYELTGKPKAAHFISILAFHFLNDSTST